MGAASETSHSLATLFFEFDVIFVFILFQLWPRLLSSSQTNSTLLNFCNSLSTGANSSQSCSIPSSPSAQLFSPLPCSSQLSPTTLTSAHLGITLLNFFSTRFSSSSTLPPSSHLRLRSTHLNLFLRPSQLFSASCHTETFTQGSFVTSLALCAILSARSEAFTWEASVLTSVDKPL